MRATDLKALAAKKLGGLATIRRDNAWRAWLRAEMRSDRAAALAVAREEAERERGIALWWRRMRVAARPIYEVKSKGARHRPVPHDQGWLVDALSHPKYNREIVDRHGRRGMFLRVRYYSKKTSKAGVGRRVISYILDGAHVDDRGELAFESNMGETAGEILAAADLLEQVNTEAQSNAKLLFHLIANVPYRLPQEAQLEIGRRFALEAFGCHDLPFALALHPPSEDGDERNWHLHIVFSFRPMVRNGDHDWTVGEHLRTEFDNPQAFRRMREIFADVMTDVANDHGLNHSYSAARNVERGLPLPTQEHAGQAKTAILRHGEPVALVDRNIDRVADGTAALADDEARRVAQDLTMRQDIARAIGRRYVAAVGMPALFGRVRSAALAPVSGKVAPQAIRAGQPGPAMPVSNLKSGVLAMRPAFAAAPPPEAPPNRIAVPILPAGTGDCQTFASTRLQINPTLFVASPVRSEVTAGATPRPWRTPRSASALHNTPVAHGPTPSAIRMEPSPDDCALSRAVEGLRPTMPAPAVPTRFAIDAAQPIGLDRVKSSGTGTMRAEATGMIRLGSRGDIASPSTMPLVAVQVITAMSLPPGRPFADRIVPAMLTGLRDLADDLRIADETVLHAPPKDAVLRGHPRDLITQASATPEITTPEQVNSSAGDTRAELKHKHAEAARRQEDERRLALNAAELVLLAQIVLEDMYVGDLGDGTFDISIENEARIGAPPGWRSSPAVQHALVAIRQKQQPLVATLDDHSHLRPLAFARTGPRPWPRDLDAALLGRVDAWSEDTGFQADLLPIVARVEDAHRRQHLRELDVPHPSLGTVASSPTSTAGAITIRDARRKLVRSWHSEPAEPPGRTDDGPTPER